MQNTRFVSWNVNGLRSWHKKGMLDWFLKFSPDFLCLQETKAEFEQLPDELREPEDYFVYLNHSKFKKGYSGVAIYTKHEPDRVEYGLGVRDLDQEGRQISLFYEGFVLINTYFPNGGGGPDRLEYKLRYYEHFLDYIERLRKEKYSIIFCGDINTAHTEIDLARPKENEKNTGFLPEERAWMDMLVEAGYIDTFRFTHQGEVDRYSYWDMKTRARDRNVGWRIDYFFISNDLKKNIGKAEILDNVFGSDHCPIIFELKN